MGGLFMSSDIICIALPLNNNTRGIVDGELIGKMKKSSILINVGRGATIDNGVLLQALINNNIAGAGIDVYENEPLSGDPPSHIVDISRLDNVLATPHIAYNTIQSTERLGEELINNIESCLMGQPVNIVN